MDSDQVEVQISSENKDKYNIPLSLELLRATAKDTLVQRHGELDPKSWVSEKQTDLISDGTKTSSALHLLERSDGTEKLSISFFDNLKQPIEIEFDKDGNISKASIKEVSEENKEAYREMSPEEFNTFFSTLSIASSEPNIQKI